MWSWTCHVNFDEHIKNICRVAFYCIMNIAKKRKLLSNNAVKTFMHACYFSDWFICALLFGLPNFLIQCLQYVLTAARVIARSQRCDYITALLIELHCLPGEQRIIFKILLFTFKLVNGLAPSYWSELLEAYPVFQGVC